MHKAGKHHEGQQYQQSFQFKSRRMDANTSSDFVKIGKGCGFVYAFENMLFRRCKTKGAVRYLHCESKDCPATAKIVNDEFILKVITYNTISIFNI